MTPSFHTMQRDPCASIFRDGVRRVPIGAAVRGGKKGQIATFIVRSPHRGDGG